MHEAVKASLQTLRSEFSIDQTTWGRGVCCLVILLLPLNSCHSSPASRLREQQAVNSNHRGHGSSFPEHLLHTRLSVLDAFL